MALAALKGDLMTMRMWPIVAIPLLVAGCGAMDGGGDSHNSSATTTTTTSPTITGNCNVVIVVINGQQIRLEDVRPGQTIIIGGVPVTINPDCSVNTTTNPTPEPAA